MPSFMLIYDTATHKNTNRSTKKIRGKILKGFRAWVLNEWFSLMGKQHQTHTEPYKAWLSGPNSATQRPHSQLKVQKVNGKSHRVLLYLKTSSQSVTLDEKTKHTPLPWEYLSMTTNSCKCINCFFFPPKFCFSSKMWLIWINRP